MNNWLRPNIIDSAQKLVILTKYISARKRLILLDFGGNLLSSCSITDSDHLQRLQAALNTLSQNKENTLIVFSALNPPQLQHLFSGTGIGMIASSGKDYKPVRSEEWKSLPQIASASEIIANLLMENDYDFVFMVGNDLSDESFFDKLNAPHHYTLKIGLSKTSANYNVINVNDAIYIFEKICKA